MVGVLRARISETGADAILYVVHSAPCLQREGRSQIFMTKSPELSSTDHALLGCLALKKK